MVNLNTTGCIDEIIYLFINQLVLEIWGGPPIIVGDDQHIIWHSRWSTNLLVDLLPSCNKWFLRLLLCRWSWLILQGICGHGRRRTYQIPLRLILPSEQSPNWRSQFVSTPHWASLLTSLHHLLQMSQPPWETNVTVQRTCLISSTVLRWFRFFPTL